MTTDLFASVVLCFPLKITTRFEARIFLVSIFPLHISETWDSFLVTVLNVAFFSILLDLWFIMKIRNENKNTYSVNLKHTKYVLGFFSTSTRFYQTYCFLIFWCVNNFVNKSKVDETRLLTTLVVWNYMWLSEILATKVVSIMLHTWVYS